MQIFHHSIISQNRLEHKQNQSEYRKMTRKPRSHVSFSIYRTWAISRRDQTSLQAPACQCCSPPSHSLRSRRLEVVDTRKNCRARRTPLACLPRARPFSLPPTTSKRLLRRLAKPLSFARRCYVHKLLVEFLPGRKFVRLGTPFTRNYANCAKI